MTATSPNLLVFLSVMTWSSMLYSRASEHFVQRFGSQQARRILMNYHDIVIVSAADLL